MPVRVLPSGKLTWLAGKWSRIEDVFPIENGDFPACYVSLLEGNSSHLKMDTSFLLGMAYLHGRLLLVSGRVNVSRKENCESLSTY